MSCFTKLFIYALWYAVMATESSGAAGAEVWDAWYYITMKYMVVAYDQRRGIGANNDLLWQRNLPADLAHFRQLTMGGTIIMGRKTYESIGRPLPQRQNIVVSQSLQTLPGVEVVGGLPAAYALARRDIFIIGGGSIYTQALADTDVIYATEVAADFPQADVFFPALPEGVWRETTREHHEADTDNRYAFDFVTYRRV